MRETSFSHYYFTRSNPFLKPIHFDTTQTPNPQKRLIHFDYGNGVSETVVISLTSSPINVAGKGDISINSNLLGDNVN